MPEGTKLDQQLQTLLETAKALNTASDQLNDILTAVEEQLVTANLGLEVWFVNDSLHELSRRFVRRLEDDTLVEYATVELGFARVAGAWQLAARDRVVIERGATYPRGIASS